MQSEKYSPFLDMTSIRATALSEAFIRRTTSINASLSSSYVVVLLPQSGQVVGVAAEAQRLSPLQG